MKSTEKGFLISRISFSETSLIVKCFTQNHGLKSFIFQGAKKKNAHVMMTLAPLEFTYYQRNDSQLGKMTEAQLFYTFMNLPFHPVKSGIVFFMAEMLQNVLHEDVKDTPLFDFIEEELMWLDQTTEMTNYPIYWLLELTQYLGFYPLIVDKNGAYFDLEDGQFVELAPRNHTSQKGVTIDFLREIIGDSKEQILALDIPKIQRKNVMKLLLDYFHFHIPNFKDLKSIEVIESLWN